MQQHGANLLHEIGLSELPRAHVHGQLQLFRGGVALPAAQLSTRGLQHPQAYGQYEPRFFGQRNELIRGDHAALRVLPADQRLGPDRAYTTAHLDLVVQQKLPGSQRSAQVVFQCSTGRDRRLHHRIKEPDRVAPRCFCGVHGQVGVFDDVFHRLALAAEQHGSHTGRAVHMVQGKLVRLVQGGKYFLGHILCLLSRVGGKRIQVFQQHQKLIAAQAGHGVAFAHTSRQAQRNLLQQDIAHVMAQCVVQGLEVVQIEAQQRAMQAGARTGGKRLLQTVQHEAAVGQVCQRVIKGQMLDLARGLGTLGDVAERADIVGDFAPIIRDGGDAHEVEVDRPAFAAVPDFAFPFTGVREAAPHGVEKGLVMVARREKAGTLAHRIFRAVARNFGEGPVRAQDDGLSVGDDHALLRLKRDGRNAQLVFIALARRDVLAHAPVTAKCAVHVKNGCAAHRKPVQLARTVFALELEIAELLMAFQQLAVLLPAGFAHPRACQLPARLAHVRGRLLQQTVFVASVHMGQAELGILLPVPVGRQDGQGAKARFVVFQLLAHAVGLGHVAEHQHDTDNLPLRIANGRRAVRNLIFGTVPREQGRVVAQPHHLALGHHHPHRIDHRLPRAGIDDAKHVRQRLAQCLGQRPACQAFGHCIHACDMALRIRGHHPITNGMQRDGQVFLTLAQLGLGALARKRHAVKTLTQLGQLCQAGGEGLGGITALGQFVGGVQQAPQWFHHAPPHALLGQQERQRKASQQEGHLGPHVAVGSGVELVQWHSQTHGGNRFSTRLYERLKHHQLV